MLDSIKYMNKYLMDRIPYKVSIGGNIDYGSVDQFVRISWPNMDTLTAVSGNTENASLRIECYTKKLNVYDHMDMALSVISLFKHHIRLENGDVIEQVGEIQVNYLDLDGAKKANILINLRKEG